MNNAGVVIPRAFVLSMNALRMYQFFSEIGITLVSATRRQVLKTKKLA